jgi:phosphatidylglycerophosphatase A
MMLKLKNFVIKFFASCFGLGYVPLAPGTFGTLVGCLLYFQFRLHSVLWMIKFAAGVALVAIVIAHLAEKSYGKKDCQKIVIDEVAGVLFCYMFVPFSVFHLVLGFILFRFFDVVKLPPANWAQKYLPGGLGVVADDLVAGLQGAAILYFLPHIIFWVNKGLGLWSGLISQY